MEPVKLRMYLEENNESEIEVCLEIWVYDKTQAENAIESFEGLVLDYINSQEEDEK